MRKLLIGLVAVVFGTLLALPSPALAKGTATVQTDRSRYRLGEHVVITGHGFMPGPVTLTIQRPDHMPIPPLPTFADPQGNFTFDYVPPSFLPSPLLPAGHDLIPGLTPGRYRVTATDGSNTGDTVYKVTSKPSKTKGRILVMLRTIPKSSVQFSLSMSYGALIGYPAGLKLPAGPELDSGYVLVPGVYTVNEFALPTGWHLESIRIKDHKGSSSAGNVATVKVEAGETVTVTFTNALVQ
jgi:hypothetical protein